VKPKTFKGVFNWYGQNFEMYTIAKTRTMAKHNFTVRISKLVERDKYTVRQYFNGQNDNYLITEEK